MSKKILFVWADEGVKEDLLSRNFPADYDVLFMNDTVIAIENSIPAAYFILDESLVKDFPFDDLEAGKLVFVNDVYNTLEEISTRKGIIRINAWPGFLRCPLLELAARETDKEDAEKLLADLHWPLRWVADIPGLVTPRVISMIFNEACFALNENISTPSEMDIALTLGTSYPRGPFEWSKQIGCQRIIKLLSVLSENDERYIPAPSILNNLEDLA
jgi:3-hydroxybutyryl-CoA dehydrogenase